MLWFLKYVPHEDIYELAVVHIFLKLVWWAVADGRIAKHWTCPHLNILIEIIHVLPQVQP